MVRIVIVLFGLLTVAACATIGPGGTKTSAPPPGSPFTDCRGCPEMVVIPAGQFMMGSPPGEDRRDPDEGPQKVVRFAKPFAVSRVPVTRGEYARFARETRRPTAEACYTDRGHPGRWALKSGTSWEDPGFPQATRDPVVCVAFPDIRAYLDWLNRRSGGGYRLLSEAEFEYAARAGATTRFPWGEEISHDQANFGEDPCCHAKAEGRDRWLGTSPGGSFPSNAFGLHDMQGNVWQFTADCYAASIAGIPDDGRPLITAKCEKRVVRSAGWDDPPYYLRSANRYQQLETLPGNVTGFRVAKALDRSPRP